MAITSTTRWTIATSRHNFNRLKKKEDFWCVVALSRAINALRFVHAALLPYATDDSPGAQRARFNSLLFNCALLYEASLFVQKLHKHHGNTAEFKALSAVVSSKSAKHLLQSHLSDLRNKLVFHFDITEIGKQLQELDLAEPIFVSGMGDTNEHIYLELGDLCAVKTLTKGAFPESATDTTDLETLLKTVTSTSLAFMDAAEQFVLAVLKQEKWRFKTPASSQ
jgi:hypothetical protein